MSQQLSMAGRTEQWLANLLADVTGLPAEQFLDQMGFDELGLDSLSISDFNAKLSRHVQGVPRSLLFDCRALSDLSDYLLRRHRVDVEKAIREDTPGTVVPKMTEGWPALRSRLDTPAARATHHSRASGTDPAAKRDGAEAIAVVGLAGRYPEAEDVAAFWRNLAAGRNSVGEIPADRWSLDGFFDAVENAGQKGRSYCKWGAFLENADRFDAEFFGIAPREAEAMDPQERLFLECAWQALEDAGIELYRSRHGRQPADGFPVSVYVGVTTQTYQLHGPALWQQGRAIFPTSLQWSIANRVSFLLNLRGPSMPVDTACSASLTALHLACAGLRNGEAEMALVGGVNLYLHPSKFVWLCQQRMLTATGQCHTFSDDADGFVPGEGVGAVVLKPLSAARRDGNHIYAVVAATSINHGGRTNGYTVPSPAAQAELVRTALVRGKIDPDTISYVEAHGTGTRLGDPIEVDGLSMAFAKDEAEGVRTRSDRCALASTKTNIGHLESAAGIAGITRILLQMKHRQIAPSLNLREVNPNIDLAGSPFRIVTSLEPWIPAGPAHGVLRAAVSSFGAGGANAHAILDAVEPDETAGDADVDQPRVFPLSARSSDALRARVRDLMNALQTGEAASNRLASLAYTLQLAREPMRYRLAIVASSSVELLAALAAAAAGREHAALFTGEVSRPSRQAVEPDSDPMQSARRWCNGAPVEWHAQWPDTPPCLLSLPPYRFGGEAYWAGRGRRPGDSGNPLPWARLPGEAGSDPRAGEDTITVRIAIAGTERFIADHLVGGRPLLSATTMLELVRGAAQRHADGHYVVFSDVTFGRPCSPRAPTTLEIQLREDEAGVPGTWRFELSSVAPDADKPEQHARGRLAIKTSTMDLGALATSPTEGRVISREDFYADCRRRGLDYGVAFQPLDQLTVGQDTVEALIRLPADAPSFEQQLVWHPGILDACFQAVVPLMNVDLEQAPVPFSIGQLEVRGSLQDACRLRIERMGGSGDIHHFSAVLVDSQDEIIVTLRNAVLLPSRASVSHTSPIRWLMPRWEETPATGSMRPTAVALLGERESLLTTQLMGALARRCQEVPQPAATFAELRGARHVLMLCAEDAGTPRTTLETLYRSSRVLIPAAAGGPIRWIIAYVHRPHRPDAHLPLIAFARTLSQECPMLVMDVIALPEDSDVEADQVADRLLAELAAPRRTPTAIRLDKSGGRRILRFVEWQPPLEANVPALRADACYLITGGAGGLGRLFATHFARQAPGCMIILNGRRQPDDDIRACQAEIRALGARADYIQADLGTDAGIERLSAKLASLVDTPLRGVVHAAGVLRDSFILRKTPSEAAEVFAPKLDALHRLDRALVSTPLDWIVLFSSLAAAMGNIGQSDYAVANAALDEFASWRNGLRRGGRRYGVTLSIDWPLWDHDGMQVDAATRQRHLDRGIATVAPEEGLKIFDAALGAALGGQAPDQLFPLRATQAAVDDITRVERIDLGSSVEARSLADLHPASEPVVHDAAALSAKLVSHLARLLAEVTGRPVERIDASTSFGSMGLDSVMIMEVNALLDGDFSGLSRTLFFECETVGDVASRLLHEQREQVAQLFGTSGTAASEPPGHPRPERDSAAPVIAHAPGSTDIAIIGLAGRYPGVRDLDDFWVKLCEGADLVTEVPATRWPVGPASSGRTKEGPYARWGSFLTDIDQFDPLFFGMSPREAERTDPQERLFLEAAWHAVEDAGYTPKGLQAPGPEGEPRQAGVFVGVMYGEYQYLGVESMAAGGAGLSQSSYASIANRVSYALDFGGPSIAVDTMCSSSLTAIHLACDALRGGSCDVALAGGVNLSLHPYKYRTLEALKFASTDGCCRSFGEGGDGYVPGEGVGAVLLKPLDRAIADGDHVYGVIRGSAVNHGGRTNGYTVPNPNAQGRLIAAALQRARIAPTRINYVEAHGTGTPLGDPIEIRGLAMAFGRAPGQSCALGSLKSNLGHLEAAAGIAAVTKVLLQLRHRALVPTIHCDPPNPNISFADTPFHVQTALADWPTQHDADGAALPRMAGVSSFGAGGSNAHLILQEAPVRLPVTQAGDGWLALVLSARSETLLARQAEQLATWLSAQTSDSRPAARDVAFTLQVGRVHHPHRLAVVARSLPELAQELDRWLGGTHDPRTIAGRAGEDVRPSRELCADEITGSEKAVIDAAREWVSGALEWAAPASPFFRVPMPGTLWARRRCWLDAGERTGSVPVSAAPTPVTAPQQPTPRQVLALFQQGRVSHAEAVKALKLLQDAGSVAA